MGERQWLFILRVPDIKDHIRFCGRTDLFGLKWCLYALQQRPRYGECLLYSERERDRKKTSSNGTQKREAKKMKRIQKEKNEAKMFEEALGLMGLDFDGEAHVCI